jgi:hypothetical protein
MANTRIVGARIGKMSAEPVHLDPRRTAIRSSAKTAQTAVTGRVSATD